MFDLWILKKSFFDKERICDSCNRVVVDSACDYHCLFHLCDPTQVILVHPAIHWCHKCHIFVQNQTRTLDVFLCTIYSHTRCFVWKQHHLILEIGLSYIQLNCHWCDRFSSWAVWLFFWRFYCQPNLAFDIFSILLTRNDWTQWRLWNHHLIHHWQNY